MTDSWFTFGHGITVVFAYLLIFVWVRHWYRIRHWRKATGEVVSVEPTHLGDSPGWKARVKFNVNDRLITGEIDASSLHGYSLGAKVEIFYDPNNPSNVEPMTYEWWTIPFVIGLLAVGVYSQLK